MSTDLPKRLQTTLAALAVVATPPERRQQGLTVASGAEPVEVATAPHTTSAPAIDWDAVAAEQNAKDGLLRNEATGLWERTPHHD